ncbi:MAG: DUF262 domain-containing protein [Nitrospirota bacterium]
MFKIENLPSKPLQWWISQSTKIDMNPPFQRQGRLWSRGDKSFLVDSILNEYDIPKIYIADFTYGNVTLNKTGLPYAIIDGKQRLEAIFDFYSGKILLDEEFVYQQNPRLKLGGLGYSDLAKNYPEVADIFRNHPLSVVHVITDEQGRIDELFVRLNRSKPLTGAEIRNAMSGPLTEIVRLIAGHELFKLRVKFTTKRAQDKNAALKLLLFEFNGKLVETKRNNLDRFMRKAKKESKATIELASRRVIDTLDRMSEIFLPGDPMLRSAGVFPVYYWLIRGIDSTSDPYVREFLNIFEKERKTNREKGNDPSRAAKVDSELMTFDRLNRSTDDERSHVERHKILEKRLKDYLQEAGKSKTIPKKKVQRAR